MQREDEYITVQELEKDLISATGNPALAKRQALQYAIMYRGEIIDSVRYRKGFISKDDLILSRHIRWHHNKSHSQMLVKNMLAANRGPQADNTAAHHIVAWDCMKAARSRLRLAAFGIDIDHEANGVFLPRFIRHTPMLPIPDAKAHTQTHTNKYYLNVEYLLDETIAEGLGREGVIETLREIGEELEAGNFPLNELISQKTQK
ncbi:AHH domain-containing protein [Thalassomonas actiniarum]|uniref:AHH domain-containing protein n=1 Tax=Thalassomonas actiniarum TaxID=485447 RepID=A0AAE9YWM6_9GAMM|nr:AHH domain-containing protein [Thalassomonas actiniarum]